MRRHPDLILPGDDRFITPQDRHLCSMLAVNQLSGFGAGGVTPPPTVSYRTQAFNTSSLTTYTFSAQDIGTAGANRHVFVSVMGLTTSGDRTVNSVTIGGVSAVQLVTAFQTPYYRSAIWVAAVPTGTTGDVVVTFSDVEGLCHIGIWAVYDLSSTTPVATATGGGADPINLNLNVVADGFVIAASQANTNGPHAWVGVTERYDTNPEAGSAFSGGDASGLTAATPRTVNVDGASTAQAAVAVSMR